MLCTKKVEHFGRFSNAAYKHFGRKKHFSVKLFMHLCQRWYKRWKAKETVFLRIENVSEKLELKRGETTIAFDSIYRVA